MQISYVDVWIPQSTSESPLDFAITRVDCILQQNKNCPLAVSAENCLGMGLLLSTHNVDFSVKKTTNQRFLNTYTHCKN